MKTLLIVRHGKSSWKDKSLEDKERPLKKRGKKESEYVGKLLVENELVPQLILTSDAVRATETAKIIAKTAGNKEAVKLVPAFYMAEPQTYTDILCTLPDTVERVMIVGHNPGLEALLQFIDGKIESLPTGSMAYLALNIKTWSELNLESVGDLVGFWEPDLESSEANQASIEKQPKSEVKSKKKDKGEKTMADKKHKKDEKDVKDKKGKKDKKEKKDKKGKKDKK